MTPEFSARTRERALVRMAEAPFDLLVVGGGITGAGVAREAVSRGMRVALVERGDFASGTSSKSSKLLHGGLRYVEQYQFHLVFEALAQRNRLFRTAPHLARELPFVFPVYPEKGDRLWFVNLGLTVYDVFSSLSQFRFHRLHHRLSQRALFRREPLLRRRGLSGAVAYTDGLTEDARLTIEVVAQAAALGTEVANHAEVMAFIQEGGRLAGARVRDRLGGREVVVRASRVVNAAGPWVDAVRQLAADGEPLPLLLRPTKGVHLVVPSITGGDAVVIKSTRLHQGKRRWLFVIPYGDRSLVGTTDTGHEGPPDGWRYLDEDAEATPDEVAYLLEAVNDVFPEAKLTPEDVLSSFGGWRPLLAPPDSRFESDISREHAIVEGPPGLFSVAGGKLTTFIPMACQAVDGATRGLTGAFPRRLRWDRQPQGGGDLGGKDLSAYRQEVLARHPQLDPASLAHLVATYGARCEALLAIIEERPALAAPLPGLDGPLRLACEPVFSVRHEQALTLADFLVRRSRIFLLDARQGLDCAPAVAALMAGELARMRDWAPDCREAWISEQLAAYRGEVARSRQGRA